MPYPVHHYNMCKKGGPLAKPNYSFEKRQRELAKKQKKEEKLKLKRKQDSGDSPASPDGQQPGGQDKPAV